MRVTSAVATVLLCMMLPGAPAHAQQKAGDFPARAVRLVVPYPPGASNDIVARLLVALVHKESPDLVVLGKQAIDGDNNQVAQLTAEYLGWPQATFAYKIELTDGNKGARVQREVDGGVETVEVTLPAVLTTDLRLNEPRYASLPGIMKAKKKPLEEVTPADLGVDTALKVETVGFEPPPGRKAGVKVKTVDELIEKLAGEAKAL